MIIGNGQRLIVFLQWSLYPWFIYLHLWRYIKKRTLKQGDCKFAFIQATLPEDKITIIKPPIGCPFSGPRKYWRLRKSLFGLRRASRHWYNKFRSVLESPEIGLTPTKNDQMGLSTANKSPLMTPYRSSFPIDTIPEISMSDEDRAPLIECNHG